jgi:hypothetical protein
MEDLDDTTQLIDGTTPATKPRPVRAAQDSLIGVLLQLPVEIEDPRVI